MRRASGVDQEVHTKDKRAKRPNTKLGGIVEYSQHRGEGRDCTKNDSQGVGAGDGNFTGDLSSPEGPADHGVAHGCLR